MAERKALLGIHDDELVGLFVKSLERRGYLVDMTTTPKEMLEKAGEKEYDIYLMDVNLGKPNTTDITPAIEIYNLIKLKVENKEAKFMAISGNREAIELAETQGIPAKSKGFFSLIDFLQE